MADQRNLVSVCLLAVANPGKFSSLIAAADARAVERYAVRDEFWNAVPFVPGLESCVIQERRDGRGTRPGNRMGVFREMAAGEQQDQDRQAHVGETNARRNQRQEKPPPRETATASSTSEMTIKRGNVPPGGIGHQGRIGLQ